MQTSPLQEAEISDSARQKAGTKLTPDGPPVHSMQTPLAVLGTLTWNEVTLPGPPNHPFPILAQPTPLLAKAFEHLKVEPGQVIPVPLIASNWLLHKGYFLIRQMKFRLAACAGLHYRTCGI